MATRAAVLKLQFTTEDQQKYRRVIRHLEETANGGLRKHLNDKLRDAARPILHEVKRNIRDMPTGTGISAGRRGIQRGHTGLRRDISNATLMEMRTYGVQLRVAGAQLGDRHNLPADIDSFTGWRHPTFAHLPWVHQAGHPWFRETIRRHAPEYKQALYEALIDTITEINRA